MGFSEQLGEAQLPGMAEVQAPEYIRKVWGAVLVACVNISVKSMKRKRAAVMFAQRFVNLPSS